MLRRLYTALCAASLLLCVLVVALWLRSGIVYDVIQLGRGNEELHNAWGDNLMLSSRAGLIALWYTRQWPIAPAADLRIETWYFKTEAVKPVGGAPRRWLRWSIGYEWRAAQRPEHNWLIGDCRVAVSEFRSRFPHWLLALTLALPPALRWGVPWWRRRVRRRRGQCLRCGYDLRGSAGVCPECGATRGVAPDAPAAAPPAA